MSTKLLMEQSRDITTAIWKERKLPPTLWQRFSHGQALSGNAASWTGNKALSDFADKLEKATIATIESGKMTKDLAVITSLKHPKVLSSHGFIMAVRETLEDLLD